MPKFLEALARPVLERGREQMESRVRGVPWGPMEAVDLMGAVDQGADEAVWMPLAESAGKASSGVDNAFLRSLLGGSGAALATIGSVGLAPSNIMPGPGDDAARGAKAVGAIASGWSKGAQAALGKLPKASAKEAIKSMELAAKTLKTSRVSGPWGGFEAADNVAGISGFGKTREAAIKDAKRAIEEFYLASVIE